MNDIPHWRMVIEPAAGAMSHAETAATVSLAISAKRQADALERIADRLKTLAQVQENRS